MRKDATVFLGELCHFSSLDGQELRNCVVISAAYPTAHCTIRHRVSVLPVFAVEGLPLALAGNDIAINSTNPNPSRHKPAKT